MDGHEFFKLPSRRVKLLEVSPELLLEGLFDATRRYTTHGMPKGSQIQAVWWDIFHRTFVFRIWNEAFEEVAEGELPPNILPEFREVESPKKGLHGFVETMQKIHDEPAVCQNCGHDYLTAAICDDPEHYRIFATANGPMRGLPMAAYVGMAGPSKDDRENHQPTFMGLPIRTCTAKEWDQMEQKKDKENQADKEEGDAALDFFKKRNHE